jgi:hypothetical protein
MARLAYWRREEVARLSIERELQGCGDTQWARTTRAVMSDRDVLQRQDYRSATDGYVRGTWKLLGRLRPESSPDLYIRGLEERGWRRLA